MTIPETRQKAPRSKFGFNNNSTCVFPRLYQFSNIDVTEFFILHDFEYKRRVAVLLPFIHKNLKHSTRVNENPHDLLKAEWVHPCGISIMLYKHRSAAFRQNVDREYLKYEFMAYKYIGFYTTR